MMKEMGHLCSPKRNVGPQFENTFYGPFYNMNCKTSVMNGAETALLLVPSRDENVSKFHIPIIVTKLITIISVVVFLKCAENIQKVLICILK